jgi:hypothetical protein
MSIFIVLMMAIFGIIGACLLFHFTRDLARRLARSPYLERTAGTVTAIKAMESHFQGDSHGNTVTYFPVITFQQQEVTQTFTSVFGDSRKNRYVIGQTIAVRYDPTGAIPPAIDSWSGMWLPPAIGIISGLVFLGGAAMVYVAFGNRVFGR